MIGTGIPCPCCGSPLNITIDFIIENPIAACPTCNSIMKFPVKDDLFKQYKEAKKELDNIKKTIKSVK